MNAKKLLIVLLIAVVVVVCAFAVSGGWLDGLFSEPHKDNVVEIENITFNTTNVTSFRLLNSTDVLGANASGYVDANDTGYNVHIINCRGMIGISFDDFVQQYLDEYSKHPTQTINGTVIYTVSADSGAHVGEPRYLAYVKNKDLQTFVEISTPDANETAKMIQTLKFN